jgi:hypothetical protein
MKQLEYVLSNDKEVLGFIKNHYPMYHLSNVFFRDVQYGIQKMFERRGDKLKYPDAEKIAKQFVEKLEKEKVFNRIDQQSWVLNYPEYKKPVITAAAAAKPAAGAAPMKSPAVGGAKPTLPPLGSAKPAGAIPSSAKSTLPPLSSAKPVGGTKTALPPLTSAKPAGAKPVVPTEMPANANANEPHVVELPKTIAAEQTKTEAPIVEVTKAATASSSPVASPPGQRKSLPPLKGNYTPAGKK